MLLGIHLSLLIGPTVAVPASATMVEALIDVQVTHSEEERSGFELTFQVGRGGLFDLADYPLLANPLLRPFNRVILVVTFNATPRVLMDGFIIKQELTPSNEPGKSTLKVTGEDISVMMDLIELKLPHPGQDEATRVEAILARYTPLLLSKAQVVKPPSVEVPSPDKDIPVQPGMTDLQYVTALAAQVGHVFYVTPGPLPAQNQAYWGPPTRFGIRQPALSVAMGPSTNVDQINFGYDGLAPTTVVDVVQDRDSNLPVPVVAAVGSRFPPLASIPASAYNLATRVSVLGGPASRQGSRGPKRCGPTSFQQASALAQAQLDTSTEQAATANGELDALRYGEILAPRSLVGLRGAGFTHDGDYRVKSVTHSIRKGEYKQRFTLSREGMGALAPFVRP